MNCPVCKIGEMKVGETTVLLERGASIIIIKNVPAYICENCGEKYYDSDITRQVMRRAEEAVQKGTELEVLRLVA
ncbi:MAG: type II toxin-antitoxin system MqsA family antitoxin [Saprospiraceae bacterium]|nr:type II toxin-antitoxin system MqsA family antitoxin [Saprospiraceae bacterium]